MGNILVIDSGVGGIPFLAAAKKALPEENFIYYADTAHAPYGDQSPQTVRKYVVDIIERYRPYGLRAVVLACNAATSSAAAYLRKRYPLPIIGMEPAVKPACEQTSGKVLVLATALTAQGEKLRRLMNRFPEREIVPIACPGLMELVERLAPLPEKEAYLQNKLAPYRDEETAVVIGCTHYAYLIYLIQMLLPKAIVFDEVQGTLAHLERILSALPKEQAGGKLLWQSSLPGDYTATGEIFYAQVMPKQK